MPSFQLIYSDLDLGRKTVVSELLPCLCERDDGDHRKYRFSLKDSVFFLKKKEIWVQHLRPLIAATRFSEEERSKKGVQISV